MHFDITNKSPKYIQGDHKWYECEYVDKYIQTEQAYNLPKLEKLMCFIVINEQMNLNDIVLVDYDHILKAYSNTLNGYDQMIAFINILKVDEHFKKFEND